MAWSTHPITRLAVEVPAQHGRDAAPGALRERVQEVGQTVEQVLGLCEFDVDPQGVPVKDRNATRVCQKLGSDCSTGVPARMITCQARKGRRLVEVTFFVNETARTAAQTSRHRTFGSNADVQPSEKMIDGNPTMLNGDTVKSDLATNAPAWNKRNELQLIQKKRKCMKRKR